MRNYRRDPGTYPNLTQRRVKSKKCDFTELSYKGTLPYLPVWQGRDYAKASDHLEPTRYFGFLATMEPYPKFGEETYDGLYYSEACSLGKQYVSKNYLAPGYATMVRPYKVHKTYDGKFRLRPDVSGKYVSQAIARIDKAMKSRDVNLGISFGESRETLQFIADSMTRVWKSMVAFKRGQWKRAFDELGLSNVKSMAGNYLAWIFGVKPIINDINNALDNVANAMSKPDFIRYRSTAVGPVTVLPHGTWNITHDLTQGCQMGYNVRIANKELAAMNALGLANPLALAWELIPFSFIVNWFVPIGAMLSSLSQGAGITVVHGYKTTFKKGTQVLTYRDGKPGYWRLKTFAMEREVLDGFHAAGLYVKFDLNLGQLFTMTAIGVALS